MIVNVEFFDEDPIENVITSLNYRVDKTIFFGYESMSDEKQKCVKRFLIDTCDVKEVDFIIVDEMDMADVIDKITENVNREIENGNQVFFDLTGGESLPLVSFGIISRELAAPMHKYDVYSNQMYEYGYEGSVLLSKTATYDPISLNLDGFISLYGGIINENLHKSYKNVLSEADIQEVKNMWEFYKKHWKKWTNICGIFNQIKSDEDLHVCEESWEVIEKFVNNRGIGDTAIFDQFLEDCKRAGFLQNVRHDGGVYSYTFKNETIKNYLCDPGSILEMHVYVAELEKEQNTDCRIGVHIDWDGVIHEESGQDVYNEIDILTIDNNLPTFISCKIGQVDQQALYELETIANRFGGKYAKKILVIAKEMSRGHLLRAKELGIEVRME